MFNIYNWLALFVTIFMIWISFKIIDHHKTLGAIKNIFFESIIVLVFFQVLSMFWIIYRVFEVLNLFQLLSLSLFCIFSSIVFPRYYNNIREKGIVIHLNKIHWEDISYLKKTDYSVKVVYNKKGKAKTIETMIFNFQSPHLHKKLKEHQINYE